ncbi:hypothetical protein AMTRI_Chr12g234180 [Amborella trichopoda]
MAWYPQLSTMVAWWTFYDMQPSERGQRAHIKNAHEARCCYMGCALLSACRIHGDTVFAEQVGRELIECAPLHTGCHVLLPNIYSSSGRWTDAKDVRALIEHIGGEEDSRLYIHRIEGYI